MSISVIIINYRKPDITKACIDSVFATKYPGLEVIVVDNTYDNIGLAAAQNKGAKQAQGKWLFFLNNDTLVKPNIFEELLKYTRFYDILGCSMFNYSWTKRLVSGISLDKFGCPAGETGGTFYPDGAIFMKKSVFKELGEFDEKLFLFGEDRDLCWRAWLAGYSVGICPHAEFAHDSSSVLGTSFFRRKLSERNIIRSMLKNYTLNSLFWILPQYAFWSILELGVILFSQPQAITESYLPAYWWNIVNLKDTLKERKKNIRRRRDNQIPFSNEIGKLYVLKTQGFPKWQNSRY